MHAAERVERVGGAHLAERVAQEDAPRALRIAADAPSPSGPRSRRTARRPRRRAWPASRPPPRGRWRRRAACRCRSGCRTSRARTPAPSCCGCRRPAQRRASRALPRRGHRVVRAEERDLVDAAAAQRGLPVACPGARGWRAVVRRGRGDGHPGGDDERGGAGAEPADAMRPADVACGRARRGGRHRDKRADRRDRDRPCAQRVDPDADCRADRVAVGRVDACRRHRRRGPREHGDDATGYGRSGPETERRVARRVGHPNRDESEHHRDTQRDPPGLPGAVRAFGEREQGAVDAAFHARDRGHHAGRDPAPASGRTRRTASARRRPASRTRNATASSFAPNADRWASSAARRTSDRN